MTLPLAVYGCICLYMPVYGYIWLYMAVYGCICLYMAVYGCIWLVCFPLSQLVCLSATLPNIEVMAKWLEASLYKTDFRPVELRHRVCKGRVVYKPSGVCRGGGLGQDRSENRSENRFENRFEGKLVKVGGKCHWQAFAPKGGDRTSPRGCGSRCSVQGVTFFCPDASIVSDFRVIRTISSVRLMLN